MISLLNKYDAFTIEATEVSTEFSRLIKDWLKEKAEKYSTIELEHICVFEVQAKLAEIRIHQARAKRQLEKEQQNVE